jgi:hypothetical protein
MSGERGIIVTALVRTPGASHIKKLTVPFSSLMIEAAKFEQTRHYVHKYLLQNFRKIYL